MPDEPTDAADVLLASALAALSVRDPLTGLFTASYVEETLEREVHGAARAKQPVSVMIVDIDGFARFNQTRGRATGDAVLRRIADILRTHIREEDIPARSGDDAFTLVLPGASWDVARGRAERMRETVKHLDEDGQGPSLTVSIGLAMFPENGSDAEGLLAAAERALRRARAEGGDQVRSATVD